MPAFSARNSTAPPLEALTAAVTSVQNVVRAVNRAGLTVQVHQRLNVRVLELIDAGSGSRIELEGNRLPVTHAKDVIEELGA